jgi:hypothetical protein
MKMLKILIIILVTVQLGFAQKITGFKQRTSGDTLIISYNLKTLTPAGVAVYCSIDSTNYIEIANNLTGDFGKRLKGGAGKQILWILQDADTIYKGKNVTIKLVSTIGKCPESMVMVEGGTFKMGNIAKEDNARPLHDVSLTAYCIDRYEVKQTDFEKVMGFNPSLNQCPDCPVDNVSWEDASEYADKMACRLPTEAEWEFAARGGQNSKNYIYSGSNNIDSVGWYSVNSQWKTHPVGQKAPNELGLFDMSGNVSEWCNDWYAADYYKHSEETDPQGPPQGRFKILRGGSFNQTQDKARTTNRTNVNFDILRSETNGFRLAKNLE